MAKATNLVFDILANDKASKNIGKVTEAFKGQSQVVSAFQKAGTAQFVALSAAAVAFGVSATGAASDLEETISKSDVIFGDQAAAMREWADSASRSAGLSRSAALAAASSFGDMFLQLGFASDAAARMSQSTVQLAADLGSFNNVDTADVLDRISAATRGEYDSLQKLIPNINAARVQSQALAMTGKTVVASLTEQEKVAAVLAIIQQDAARASGDFERTSDGLANSQRILAAEYDNLRAELGTGLLPIMTRLVQVGTDAVTWANENRGAATALAITVGTLSTAIAVAANWQKIHTTATTLGAAAQWSWNVTKGATLTLLGRSTPLTVADTAATEAATVAVLKLNAATAAKTAVQARANAATLASSRSVARWGGAMGSAALVLGVVIAQIDAANKAIENGRRPIEEMTQGWEQLDDVGLDNLIYDLEQTRRELEANVRGTDAMWDNWANLGNDSALSAAGDAIAELNEHIGNTTINLRALADETGLSFDEVKAIAQQNAIDLSHAFGTDEARMARDAVIEVAGAMSQQRREVIDLTDAVKAHNKELQESIKLHQEASGVVLSERDALRGFEAAIDAVTDAQKENGRTLDVTTEKGRENQATLDDIVSATWDWIEAGAAADMSQAQLAGRMIQGRQAFIDAATQLGMTADEATALADKMNLIPSAVTTIITADTSQAERAITGLRAMFNSNQWARYDKARTQFATGGPVRGPGTSTSDSISIDVSDEEFVHQASAHRFWGTGFMYAVNNRDLGAVLEHLSARGLAGGGAVSSAKDFVHTVMGGPGLGGAMPVAVSLEGAVLTLVDDEGNIMGRLRAEIEDALDGEHRNARAIGRGR